MLNKKLTGGAEVSTICPTQRDGAEINGTRAIRCRCENYESAELRKLVVISMDKNIKGNLGVFGAEEKVSMALLMKSDIELNYGNERGAIRNLKLCLWIIQGKLHPRDTEFWEFMYD